MREEYRRKIIKLSENWVKQPTITKLIGVSDWTTIRILNDPDYIPSKSVQERVKINIDSLLYDLQSIKWQ